MAQATTLVDFGEFHRVELPRRLAAGNGALAHEDVRGTGPLAVRLADTGEAFTYVPSRGSIDVIEGTDAARTVIELDQQSWDGLALDLDTAPGLLYSGRVNSTGNVLRFVEWEPALRAMYHGRPIFDPARSELLEPDGAPLDPQKSFRLDDERDEMQHFLATAGFILVRGVFTEAEVAEMLAGADRLRTEAVEGDKKSWWGRNASGESILCRVTNASRLPVFARLYEDPRLLRFAELSEHELTARAKNSDEGVTVLWKNPDMAEGLSDLPWHRDCGMGGHATMCPLLIATVYLTEGNRSSGELRVMPGSHKGSFHFIDGNDPDAPEGLALVADPGDVTFHYSDIAHVSMPPESSDGPHRISALVAFVPPDATHHRGEGHYNDALLDRDDGQIEHLRDKVQRAEA